MKNLPMKILRIVAIVLMGLTAAFTLFGGAGTVCVALAAEQFGEKMALIAPYKWLYVLFVLATLAVGVLGVRAVVMLIKGRQGAYRMALIALISGLVVGFIHILASRAIRGASMPVDAVVFTTLLTLIFFLFLRIPGIWKRIDLEKPSSDHIPPNQAAAIVLLLNSILSLSVQYWAGPTHTFSDINYADAWHTQLSIIGWGMIILALIAFALPVLSRHLHQAFSVRSSQQAEG